MKFDTEYIEKLADVINEKGLTEISLEDGNQAITIRKDVYSEVPVVQQAATHQKYNTESHKGKPITAPMVGTFYLAASPESEPFVKIGQVVSKGQVVCIIEAMKLMNEIESEHTGTVIEICVEQGQPVEYGQVLMYVE